MSALAGKRIVSTRAVHQNADFDDLLREHGAEPLHYPCIAIAPPNQVEPFDLALKQLSRFDWLVLTSANTVQAVANRMAALGISTDTLAKIQVAVVGPATADTARETLGVEISAMPDEFIAEALAAAMQPIDGAQVLLPISAIAESTLADKLTAAGAHVMAVDAYRTVIGSGGIDLTGELRAGTIDAITFTSSSTVDNLLKRLEADGGSPDLLSGVCLACIGPKTAATARRHGLSVTLVPDDYTLPGLVAALEHYFAGVSNAHS